MLKIVVVVVHSLVAPKWPADYHCYVYDYVFHYVYCYYCYFGFYYYEYYCYLKALRAYEKAGGLTLLRVLLLGNGPLGGPCVF